MKLQIQGQSLRFRIDEAELAALLETGWVQDRSELGADRVHLRRIESTSASSASLDWQIDSISLRLPLPVLRDYAASLPRRDALPVDCGLPLRVDFEVDVRDSLQRRGPRRREG